jgi:uncharacterized protein YcfJ
MKTIAILMVSMLISVSALAQDHRSPSPPVAGEESSHFAWADVLRVDPIFEDRQADGSATPPPQPAPSLQQDCYDEQVPITAPPSTDRRAGGAIFGAIIGGLLGNTVGKGDGRKAATAAGAFAGAVVGNNVAGGPADNSGFRVERHCRPASGRSAAHGRIVAYDVEYRYRGEIYMARLAYDPGDRMRVRVSVVPAE